MGILLMCSGIAIEGIEWVAYDQPDVVNMSLGFWDNTPTNIVSTAINNINLSYPNITFVVAAGNSGQNGSYSILSPGAASSVISVASADLFATLPLVISDFSSLGPVAQSFEIKPDITAHGASVLSAVPDGDYAILSGTSMASPHIAGAVALMLDYSANNMSGAWSSYEIKTRLMNAATPISHSWHGETVFASGAGYADVFAAAHANSQIFVNYDRVATEPDVPFEEQDFMEIPTGSFSFGGMKAWGYEDNGDTHARTLTAGITNERGIARTYTIDYEFTENLMGEAALSFCQTSITVSPGETVNFEVTLEFSDPWFVSTGFYEGFIYVRYGAELAARLPFAKVVHSDTGGPEPSDVIIQQPESQEFTPGGSAEFQVAALNGGNPSISWIDWQFSSDIGESWNTIWSLGIPFDIQEVSDYRDGFGDVRVSTLELSDIESRANGFLFRAVVHHSSGHEYSHFALLHSQYPRIVRHPEKQEFVPGEYAIFQVALAGDNVWNYGIHWEVTDDWNNWTHIDEFDSRDEYWDWHNTWDTSDWWDNAGNVRIRNLRLYNLAEQANALGFRAVVTNDYGTSISDAASLVQFRGLLFTPQMVGGNRDIEAGENFEIEVMVHNYDWGGFDIGSISDLIVSFNSNAISWRYPNNPAGNLANGDMFDSDADSFVVPPSFAPDSSSFTDEFGTTGISFSTDYEGFPSGTGGTLITFLLTARSDFAGIRQDFPIELSVDNARSVYPHDMHNFNIITRGLDVWVTGNADFGLRYAGTGDWRGQERLDNQEIVLLNTGSDYFEFFGPAGFEVGFQIHNNHDFWYSDEFSDGDEPLNWEEEIGAGRCGWYGIASNNILHVQAWLTIPDIQDDPVHFTYVIRRADFGNVDDDRRIDAADLTLLRRYLAGHPVTPRFCPTNADINRADGIEIDDITRLRNHISGHTRIPRITAAP